MSKRTFVGSGFASEIEDFLTERGFTELNLPNTKERVFGKRVETGPSQPPKTLRVYTSVDTRTGQIRECGSDATRVELFYRTDDGEIKHCGHSRRVNRIKTWKKNLKNRLDQWKEDVAGPTCRCGSPMTVRSGEYGKFWGCTDYPFCTNTKQYS